MSYEMDRARHIGSLPQAGSAWGGMSSVTFTSKVMPIFGLALLATAGGVYAGMHLLKMAGAAAGPILIAAIVAELGLVFTSNRWQRKEGLNRLLFIAYAVLTGVTLVPLLTWAGMRGGLPLIAQALSVTAVTFGGLAVYGATSKRDFANLGGFVFVGVLALFVAGLVNLFLQSSGLAMLLSLGGVLMFSVFTVFQMNVIRNHYADADWVGAALGLFISFIGMFQSILHLFGLMSSSDD
ncbi:MAG: Bax inhibitor-1/YccA family protein [Candidatus Sericytochromatia bacterium]|nr:Bax inhibitor-1/YccA family protein [Candidatus Sericytochromatia bacterium]